MCYSGLGKHWIIGVVVLPASTSATLLVLHRVPHQLDRASNDQGEEEHPHEQDGEGGEHHGRQVTVLEEINLC